MWHLQLSSVGSPKYAAAEKALLHKLRHLGKPPNFFLALFLTKRAHQRLLIFSQRTMGVPHIVISAEDLEKGPLPKKHDQPQSEAPSILPSAYYDLVTLKLQQRPWLESLYQFMNPATEGFAMQPSRRMEDFDIKVIHFTESGKPDPVIKCSAPEGFKRAVSEEKERTGTFIIAKGLSRVMIEVLQYRVKSLSHLSETRPKRVNRDLITFEKNYILAYKILYFFSIRYFRI
ncbi:hypothetical protein BDZ45DRAFT_237668 [Acephala macrosclerotiorum]|nr:hypothetical protein BDZ45DRAFT_237668 [Acephala macrosclerotiorum]